MNKQHTTTLTTQQTAMLEAIKRASPLDENTLASQVGLNVIQSRVITRQLVSQGYIAMTGNERHGYSFVDMGTFTGNIKPA